MRVLALVGVALVAMSQVASAAPYNWAGFYAGFNLGVDAGSSTFTDAPSGNGLPWLITGDTFTGNRVGANIGIDAGYNLQVSDFVVGVEGDLGYLGGDGRGESQSVFPPGAGIFGYIQGGGYASLRLRAGIAADRLLVFATAGGIIADHGAYMRDDPDAALTGDTGPVGGWTAGGGLEYALTDNWTIKLDALYYSLATKTVRSADTFAGPAYDVDSSGEIVRLGFNYQL